MSRSGWLAARLLQIIPTLIMIGLTTFVLARLLPGDVVIAMLGERGSDEAIARRLLHLGEDRRPIVIARTLAEAWPGDVSRETLIARAFGGKRADESHRGRLRVEVGRLRRLET